MKLLILNYPNLNRLGVRETHIYGTKSYEELVKMSKLWAQEHGFETDVRQSNHENILIDLVQCVEMMGYHALLINPEPMRTYSYALADALRSVSVPKVEVHLSDIMNRENFRQISVTASACDKLITGYGFDGYRQSHLLFSKNGKRTLMHNENISVKNFVDFMFTKGDIDQRMRNYLEASEGVIIHQYIQKNYPSKAEAEVPVMRYYAHKNTSVTLNGRMDGVFCDEEGIFRIDEIKSTQLEPEKIEEPYYLHEMQVKMYALMFAQNHQLIRLTIALPIVTQKAKTKIFTFRQCTQRRRGVNALDYSIY